MNLEKREVEVDVHSSVTFCATPKNRANKGKIGLKATTKPGPEFGNRNCTSMVWLLADYIKNNLLLQLVDVSESHQSANGDGQNDAANVKLVFNQNWRPGVTVSSLIIQRVNKSHNGVFQCIPSNSEAKQIKVFLPCWLRILIRRNIQMWEFFCDFSKHFDFTVENDY